jgi:hypothetical protein
MQGLVRAEIYPDGLNLFRGSTGSSEDDGWISRHQAQYDENQGDRPENHKDHIGEPSSYVRSHFPCLGLFNANEQLPVVTTGQAMPALRKYTAQPQAGNDTSHSHSADTYPSCDA